MIGRDNENGGFGRLAKLGDVIGVAIENSPTDPSRGRRASNLGKGGAADGLKNNGVGAMLFFGLNSLQKLCALSDSIVIRVNYLKLDTKSARGRFRGLRLLDLVIVVVGCERNEKT